MKKTFYLTVLLISFFNAFSQNNQGTPVTGTTSIYREISSNTTPPSAPPTTQSTLTAGTPTGSSTEVGITEGQLSVSLSGAANYSIPIAVPPGLNGVVPQISLSYSSQAGNMDWLVMAGISQEYPQLQESHQLNFMTEQLMELTLII